MGEGHPKDNCCTFYKKQRIDAGQPVLAFHCQLESQQQDQARQRFGDHLLTSAERVPRLWTVDGQGQLQEA